jgi:putative PIN family toxin of toxin-antitoxin system
LKADKVRKSVFDTNVYISALITKGGRAEQAWLLAIEGKIEVYTSVPVVTEMARKLRKKFHWEDNQIRAAIRHIAKIAQVVKPEVKLNVLADKPDNRILECARHAGAEYIVTGDRHLLRLASFEGIEIVSIANFLAS